MVDEKQVANKAKEDPVQAEHTHSNLQSICFKDQTDHSYKLE